jgi:hypothetical protein
MVACGPRWFGGDLFKKIVMTQIEIFKNNIGKPFKIKGFTGLSGSFDKILSVDNKGIVKGEFIEAHVDDCRLKEQQPEQLKRHQLNQL